MGGWIGKSLGGALGAHFEGIKAWIDLSLDEIIPETIPPNDDLDLQVLWLKVLEEKGPSLTSEDLAQAWIEGCWYSFNEYGNFRRNYRNGINPPYTGRHDNTFYESGMGCPIRSEIWGYILPDVPDLAAKYAWYDGTLDHTEEATCSEQMFSAIAADAFFHSDLRRLAENHMHYLQPGLVVTRLVKAAFESYDQVLSLREARQRLIFLGGHPEQCDAQINVPFTFLALLYGEYDLEKNILAALQCGYDTDCTLATAGAFIGQILGAKGIPKRLRDIVSDDLVMGIEYRRKEMTLSALARDTANVGMLFADVLKTGVEFVKAPEIKTYLKPIHSEKLRIDVDYRTPPAVAPGQSILVDLKVKGTQGVDGDAHIEIETPKNEEPFGVAGSMVWRLLGIYFDPCISDENGQITREMLLRGRTSSLYRRHYYIVFDKNYIDEKTVSENRRLADSFFEKTSRLFGHPALLVCPDSFIKTETIVGLRGEWVCYLDAEFYSPETREVGFWIGSNDGYRIYFNGKMVKEIDIQRWWTPGEWNVRVPMRKGRNRILLKLFKRSDEIKFSFGIRQHLGCHEFPGKNDWITDLEWWNPLIS